LLIDAPNFWDLINHYAMVIYPMGIWRRVTAFLIFAYVLGHSIAAVTSFVLDKLYDKIYLRWKRANSKYEKNKRIENSNSPGKSGVSFWFYVIKSKEDFKDELLIVAKNLKKQQLLKIAHDAEVEPLNISNTFWWAGTIVRATIPEGASEIETLSAQSKLFRSLTIVILFAFFGLHFVTWYAFLIAVLVAVIIILLCIFFH